MNRLRIVSIFLISMISLPLAGCGTTVEKPLLSSAAPAGAIVLFDGRDLSAWQSERGGEPGWRLVDGAVEVVPGAGGIMTKRDFNDFKLHVEFNVPKMRGKTGQLRGNSGVYIQRRYEVQILDSFGVDSGVQDCGAIYMFKAPDINVCKKPGEWQSYDIIFIAPKWAGAEKVENARITVIQNGTMIHNNVGVPNKTGAGQPEGPGPAPILLQDHGDKVKYRNIWVIPIE
jgi:hypothetical protein